MRDHEDKPLVLLDPHPRRIERLFDSRLLAELESKYRLISHDGGRMPDSMVERYLPEAVALIGQTDLPGERLQRARKLRAVFNCEGNFYQNIDYPECFARGMRVLGCGAGYAQAVAEMALGMALDLARSITYHDRLFRLGEERYLAEACADSILLCGQRVGLVGFGALGRALRPLLTPFRCSVSVYDPWLPDTVITEAGATPCALDQLLETSRFIFILAGATQRNRGFLGTREFERIQPGSHVLLLSRAAVVDFEALLRFAQAGRFKVALDVFPEEPVPRGHPVRQMKNVLLSPHRAGGIPEAFFGIGQMIADDLELIVRGLPPVRMQRAEPEIVGQLMSKPAP